MSDLNPWLAWLGPAARAVKAQRQAVGPTTRCARSRRRACRTASSASLDYYRALRDADERSGVLPDLRQHVLALMSPTSAQAEAARAPSATEPRELPFVKEALASIARRRLSGGVRARGVPARAQGRAAAAVAAAAEAGAGARLRGPAARRAARPVAAHSRRAGNHRALRAANRRSRRCRSCCPTRPIASGCSTLLDGCWPTSACRREADARAAGDARAHPRACWRADARRRPRVHAADSATKRTEETHAWNASTRSTSA